MRDIEGEREGKRQRGRKIIENRKSLRDRGGDKGVERGRGRGEEAVGKIRGETEGKGQRGT